MAVVSAGRVDDSTSHRTVSAHIAKGMKYDRKIGHSTFIPLSSLSQGTCPSKHPKKTQIIDNCDLRALRKESNPLSDCWKEFCNKEHDFGARHSVAMSVVGKKRNFTREVQVCVGTDRYF